MVLLVHATLQWHNIGEKQSKFLMLGDILSAPGHFNPSAIEVPANCFHERWPLPALDEHPHLSARSVAGGAEAATWCLHPASPCQLSPPLFRPLSSLDSTRSARQIKALPKRAALQGALEKPCCLPWPGGVTVGGGGLEGSGVRRVSCHNAKDSARSIIAAALPPAAEEPLPWLRGKRSRFGRSPTQLSKQDATSGTERERRGKQTGGGGASSNVELITQFTREKLKSFWAEGCSVRTGRRG